MKITKIAQKKKNK